ncbi:cobyrinic acid a,c-diamide synthase [Pseudomonas sp. PA15(2017)]|uniref:ParA family protein n=1 Tax=Pseudomonas sp. PA15(2017) TaxID=1932111 RepID=UPI00095E27F2|nr:ParA family protein [Pseudomonas sp. PA15(2017)]OLU25459.1 cobyrinic acid a,c-diamide synthase [Pseudomonas sp. PA15(2017)]
MQTTATLSTKGGTGKTTGSSNLGALSADAGLRTLLIDLDTSQPTLSSYFQLDYTAPGGVYDLLVHNIVDADKVISRTRIPNLDIILSNDPHNQLETLLLHAPDGRLRLRSLLTRLPNDYDLVIIDTKGTAAVTVEMALVAANNVISPLYPEMLAAREFHRGTLQLFQGVNNLRRTLGLDELPLNVVFNRQDNSNDARDIAFEIRDMLGTMDDSVKVLETHIPALVTYRVAASQGIPAHHLERTKPSSRRAASALQTMQQVACEVWPHWKQRFEGV